VGFFTQVAHEVPEGKHEAVVVNHALLGSGRGLGFLDRLDGNEGDAVHIGGPLELGDRLRMREQRRRLTSLRQDLPDPGELPGARNVRDAIPGRCPPDVRERLRAKESFGGCPRSWDGVEEVVAVRGQVGIMITNVTVRPSGEMCSVISRRDRMSCR
jgi:hypothetical protein